MGIDFIAIKKASETHRGTVACAFQNWLRHRQNISAWLRLEALNKIGGLPEVRTRKKRWENEDIGMEKEREKVCTQC